jgi:hypothetical protein
MPTLRPDLPDLLALAGYALITAGGVLLWGSPALLLSGAVLLGFGVWSSLRVANLKPPEERNPDGIPE